MPPICQCLLVCIMVLLNVPGRRIESPADICYVCDNAQNGSFTTPPKDFLHLNVRGCAGWLAIVLLSNGVLSYSHSISRFYCFVNYFFKIEVVKDSIWVLI